VGLYVRFRQENFKAYTVADFLRALLGHMRRNVILVWDRSPIHKGPILAAVRQRYPRLHVEWLPGYAPELNPVEWVWGDFKGHTANGLPQDKEDIRQSLHANTRRVRRSQDKLRSFIRASDLPSPPW
jgi:transposase